MDQVALEKALVAGKDGCNSIEEASERSTDLSPSTNPEEPSMQKLFRRSDTLGSALEVTLPTKAEVAEPRADPQELLRRIIMWVLLNNELGCLGEEGKQLTVEHREAIFIFLCSFSAKKKSVFRALVGKVLKALDSCEEWRAGRKPHVSAEVSAAKQP